MPLSSPDGPLHRELPSPDVTAAASPPSLLTDPRIRAGIIGLVVGTALLAAKFYGWQLTGSQVVFSDAMESIVNVTASLAALAAIWVSRMPPDESHPYGHGKIEFITGGFEGGLIAFAAIVIVYEACMALVDGAVPHDLGVGIGVVAVAGVANLLLGMYLVRCGKAHSSPALEADGQHVMSDFWTSAGAVIGLTAVQLTGIEWLDPAAALVFAFVLLRTGYKLVREAARGLMDEYKPALVEDLAQAMEQARVPGVIEVHDLKAIDVGGFRHVDCHVVVPEFWSVTEAHAFMDAYEAHVMGLTRQRGEVQFHMDPCERAYCSSCDFPECPIREAAFASRVSITGDNVIRGPHAEGEVHADRQMRRDTVN
jgi:cation diffusion facilitator family transporter